MGVADAQAEEHPLLPSLIESFGTRQQQLADLEQRIGLPPEVAERLVLHSSTDSVDAAVGGAHHMKGIRDAHGVLEVWAHAGPRVLGQVGGGHLDGRKPRRSCRAHHLPKSAALLPSAMSMTRRRSKSMRPLA
jgi:hypothetical protein